MPGLLLQQPGKMEEAAGASQPVLPSKLIGPPLKIQTTCALDMLHAAFDRYGSHLAVASMYQPANYLECIFDSSHPALVSEAPAAYLRWSYARLKHAGELLAVSFAARGVREGMTIAAFVRGGVEFYMLFYAALILRCRFSPMNYNSIANTNEVQHMLQLVQADVLVTNDKHSMERVIIALPDISAKLVLRVALENNSSAESEPLVPAASFEYFEDLVLSASSTSTKSTLSRFQDLRSDPDETVVILFTSGTSSFPKACPMTNRVLCAFATGFAQSPNAGTSSVVCNHLPIYHIASGISGGWNPLTSGAAVVHPAPSFTAGSTLQAMRQENVTYMVLVPSMIGLMIEDPALPPPGQISLKSLSLGASSIQYTDVEKCYKHLGVKRVITSYGMTEGLMMTRGHLPRESTPDAREGIQQICAGARLKLCLPNSRTPVPRGEPGEVHQGGATTIPGYIGQTSDAFYEDEDGVWCITGDQAIMREDGGVKITGRYKDLIIRGGVNVSPQAIEGVISRILNIEASVVGMPDAIAGEVPVAIVKKADLGKTSLQSLREPIMRELGPRFALERFISLEELGLEEFPLTSTRKVRKIDLRELVKEYAQKLETKIQAKAAGKSTLSILIETFSDAAGLGVDDLSPDTAVNLVADSLTLARYTANVREAFGRPFTLPDLNQHLTLGSQAKLLDSRAESGSTHADLLSEHEGPPALEDILHAEGDNDAAEQTKEMCESILQANDFGWDDVQDVVAPSQWLQSWVKTRDTSDRFRVAYSAYEADVPTFTAAFKEALLRHDSLRAVTIPGSDATDMQAILRGNEKWTSKVVSVREQSVATVKELEKLIPADFPLVNGLLQVVIAHVEETGAAGACLMTVHSTFDAFSLNTLKKDLNLILNGLIPPQHVPYKVWADHLYNLKDSAQAKTSISHNFRRLRGLSQHTASLWPPQRALVWQRGCDRGLHITPEGMITNADDIAQRQLLDGPPEQCSGSTGLRRAHAIKDMPALQSDHRLSAPIIVKAALVMLETQLTGQSTALFSQTFAMRDNWPFVDSWVSSRLPSPLEVTGPTLARVVEAVPIHRELTVVQWLRLLSDEQDQVIEHAHAPYRAVYDALNRGSVSSSPSSTRHGSVDESAASVYGDALINKHPEEIFNSCCDGEIMESVRKRINFQWLPDFGNDKKVKEQVCSASSSHFNEVGLAVKAGMLPDHETVYIRMQWDDGNIRSTEATAWIDDMIKYVELLGDKENWERPVGELYDVTKLPASCASS